MKKTYIQPEIETIRMEHLMEGTAIQASFNDLGGDPTYNKDDDDEGEIDAPGKENLWDGDFDW